jgi:tetratricopeptide (TPR) repeat protein
LATLGLRGITGQLSLVADGKRFRVGFAHGAVVAAASPLASDAAVRVALTSHLVSSSQVPEISRRQVAAPGRDEIELISELARLGPEHALRLRRRVIAQRAARTFSVQHGEFVVTDRNELEVLPGCELDVRAVVYLGARTNLSEQRLSAELEQLGAWFQLRPGTDDDLPQFGFSDLEQPVVERLRDGGTLAEIEDFASSFVEGSTVRAVIYALASCNACNLEPPPGQPRARLARAQSPSPAALAASTQSVPRSTESTQPVPQFTESTQPMMREAGPAPSDEPMRTMTQPLTRSPGSRPPEPSDARAPRPTPSNRTIMPANQAARPAAMPLTTKPTPTGAEPAVPKTTTRVATVPPPPRPPPTSGSTVPPPASEPSDSEDSAGARRPSTSDPTDPGSMRARRPTDDAKGWDNPSGSTRATTRDAVPRSRSSASIHLPSDEVISGSGSSGSIRLPDGARRSDRSSASLRIPSDEALREALNDARTQTGDELTNRNLASEALRIRPADLPRGRRPSDEAARRDGSSGSIGVPSDDALRDSSARGPGDARRRPGSSPGLRQPIEREAASGMVVRPVAAARPPPTRQVARVDTPQSHEVKALIAQRLKLLDQGADHFQLLGVPPEVGNEVLRKAYFSLARQLHPDRLAALGISDDGRHAQRLFAQINAGFAILSDHARRTKYVDVLRRGGEAAVRAEQARAEELTRRILEAEEAYRRGDLALRRDQPAAAVTELERAVQHNPDEADYHAALAWARFCAALDKPAAAAATRAGLDRALQRAPRSVTARFYLGRVERMLGRDQDALKHFRDVVAASPGHAEAAAELRILESRLADKPGKPRR